MYEHSQLLTQVDMFEIKMTIENTKRNPSTMSRDFFKIRKVCSFIKCRRSYFNFPATG